MDYTQNPKSGNATVYVILGVVIGVLLVGVSFLGYLVYNNTESKIEEMTKTPEDINSEYVGMDFTSITEENDLLDTSDLEKVVVTWSGKAEKLPDEERKILLNKLYPDYESIVSWIKEKHDFCFDNSTLPMCTSGFDPEIYLYQVGITSENYSVFYVVMPQLISEPFSSGYTMSLGYYDNVKGNFISLFGRNITYNIEDLAGYLTYSLYDATDISSYKNFELYDDIKEVNLSEEFTSLENNIKLENSNIELTPIGFFSAGLFGLSNIDGLGDFGLSSELNPTNDIKPVDSLVDFTDGTSLTDLKYSNGCFYRLLSNGSIYGYRVQPYFFIKKENGVGKQFYPESFLTTIEWFNSDNSKEEYIAYGQTGGCTGPNLTCNEIVTSKDWFNKDRLVEIGKTTLGESVYELQDKKSNKFYKEFFKNFGYTIYGYEEVKEISEETKFAKFLADQPLFFWQDKWDNWRMYQKAKYQPMAECGKPVIYLYPEQEMDVNVQVEPNAGFSKTEPAYPENGWVVKSSVDSEIYNYADNTIYPYLFWEGNAYNFVTPDYGFVMSKDDVSTRMKNILGRLGLVEKEINDFMEFWQPKLEVKPYVFVTFLPQREFDKIAPLTVSPAPDTVIRVMMDYKPLDAPIKVQEPVIWTPQRKGFTVVEWGGRLH